MNQTKIEAETREYLTQALLVMIRLARNPSRPSWEAALNSLTAAVAKGPDLSKMHEAMEALKNEIQQAAMICGQAASPGDSLPKTQAKTDHVHEAKEAYLSILSQLEFGGDNDYMNQWVDLREKITMVQDLPQLLALRHGIESLIQRYVQRTFGERKNAADFITEVAKRLSELEQYLQVSVGHLQKGFELTSRFDAKMQAEITRTSEVVGGIYETEELKQYVMSKLHNIGNAIKSKNVKEKKQFELAHRDLGEARAKFADFQGEVTKVYEEKQALLVRLKNDHLTGAFNRLAAEEFLAEEITHYKKAGKSFCLLVFDIDYFKNINDTFGHIIGDRCLQQIVINIKAILRLHDILARYGGDEFLVILPDTNKDQAIKVAEKLRQKIEMTDFTVKGRLATVTISVGITEILPTDNTSEEIIDRADRALYLAKGSGRNRVASA